MPFCFVFERATRLILSTHDLAQGRLNERLVLQSVPLCWSVRELKERIKRTHSGCPVRHTTKALILTSQTPERQRLVYAGRLLGDDLVLENVLKVTPATLHHINKQADSHTIHLVIKEDAPYLAARSTLLLSLMF